MRYLSKSSLVIELPKMQINFKHFCRINALVEQEVRRRMFEEKLQREQKRLLERDRDKREREEEIKRLKEAHHREIRQLKARYEKRLGTVLPLVSSCLSTCTYWASNSEKIWLKL